MAGAVEEAPYCAFAEGVLLREEAQDVMCFGHPAVSRAPQFKTDPVGK